MMLRRLHPIAGVIGFLTIATFWTSTVLVEIFGNAAAILSVKTATLWGLLVLIPALATTGATGFQLAGPGATGLAAAKRRRMPVIAANGIILLVPSAVCLQQLAAAGDFGATFVVIQAIELVAGAVNLALMGLNMRDGLRMTRHRRHPKEA